MKKVRKLFLDNYDICSREKADLIVFPKTDENGQRAPELYYKRIPPADLVRELSGDVLWSSTLKFDITVDQDTFNGFVDWWFDNMDEAYAAMLTNIAANAIDEGFDLKMSVEKARNKLKVLDREYRRGYFSKFLMDWVSTGCARYLNKQYSSRMCS